MLSAISWADLLEVTCKQQATGSSRAWPTPKDDLSRSVLYLHYVSLSNSILILKRNFKYPGQLVNPIPTGCCHVTLIYRLIPPMAGRNRVKEDDLFRSVLNLHCVSFFLISIHVWIYCKVPLRKGPKQSITRIIAKSKLLTYPPNLINFATKYAA